MADFCFQCSVVEMGWCGSDFDHYGKDGQITAEEVAEGKGVLVLCEGCGPTFVDHKGRCLGGCDGLACRDAAGNLPEVPRGAEEWLGRREGRLGRLYRWWDWWAGTPWEPGMKHHLRWRWYDWLGNSAHDFTGVGDSFDGSSKPVGAGIGEKIDWPPERKKPEKNGSNSTGVPY